jgi:hypothetical protein
MKEGGLHIPRIKPSSPLHSKLEGRRFAGEPPRLQRAGTPRYNLWFTQEIAHKAVTPCSLTLSRANSSTNILKACAKPKNVINELLGGLENFFRVWVDSHELQQPQMTQSEVLYKLDSSRCLLFCQKT